MNMALLDRKRSRSPTRLLMVLSLDQLAPGKLAKFEHIYLLFKVNLNIAKCLFWFEKTLIR